MTSRTREWEENEHRATLDHGLRADDTAVYVLSDAGDVQSMNAAGRRLLSADQAGVLQAALSDPTAHAGARAGLPATVAVNLGRNGPTVSLSLLGDGNGGLLAVATPLAAPSPSTESLPHPWLDDLPAMIAYFGADGRCVRANRRLCERLGFSAEFLRGRALAELAWSSDRRRLAAELAQLGRGEANAGIDLDLATADGQRLPVEVVAVPLRDRRGLFGGYWALFQDVTARRAIEDELERYTHELEQLLLRLDQRTKELEQANEDLRHARVKTLEAEELARLERLRTAFLEVAAHELRTPVTLLIGILECLAGEHPPMDEGYMIRTAVRSARRLGEMVENAIKLLRSEQPEASASFKLCSLTRTLEAAADDVQPFVELRSQRLVRLLPGNLPKVVMDRSMIRDVAANLLINAVKFTPDGRQIVLRADQPDENHLRFEVSDEGIGIAESDRPHIFDRFFGTLDTRHHSSGVYEFNKRGPGLGLAIVRKFVELHGGAITVDSSTESGTRFAVTLPLRQTPRDRRSPSSREGTAGT